MRFLEYMKENENQSSRTVCEFMYGMDDSSGEYAENKEVLADCENMLFIKGRFRTREGFSAIEESVMAPVEYADTVYLPFTVTDTVYYMSSKRYNIAYRCEGDDTFAELQMFFIDGEGNILPGGSIEFHRISESSFGIPKNVFFIVDRKVSADGNGVFAFVTCASNEVTTYRIYEACGGFTRWDNAQNSIYVPTVRINGRGGRYETASPLENLNYPEPERPETLNVLYGKFKCYFTTDGLSAIFRLPYGDLDPVSPVACRVYLTSEEYTEWIIPPSQNSASAEIFERTVYVNVDRVLGIIRFTDGQRDYGMPLIPGCPLNNIMVSAETAQSGSPGEVISSKGAAALGGRLYVYGNDVRPNCIYCAKQNTPLYFPEDAKLYLGDGSTGVTALKVQNGKLIAFKPGEVYRIITAAQSEKQEKEAILPETVLYLMGDKLSVQTIDGNIGCSAEKTLLLCGSRLVWLGSDGNVYALATTTYGNTTNVYRVSQPVAEHLKELNAGGGIFAVKKDGHYILISGGDALVMNYKAKGFGYSKSYYAGDDELKSPAWYRWKMPRGVSFLSAASIGDEVILTANTGDGMYSYLSRLSGEKDSAIVRENFTNRTVYTDIRSGFVTKLLDFGKPDRLKTVDCVVINGKCDVPAKLTFSNGVQKTSANVKFAGKFEYAILGTGLAPCRGFTVSLYCDKPFSLRSLTAEYKMLGYIG